VNGVPLDRGDGDGSNGASYISWLWLWRWLGGSGVRAEFSLVFFVGLCLERSCACGSGGVAVNGVPLERGDQRGHFGANLTVWLWLWRWLGGKQHKPLFFFFSQKFAI
jgi:hypothetical protein